MKPQYDSVKLKSRKNPYASKKKPVTTRLSEDVAQYFKGMADKVAFHSESSRFTLGE